MKNLRMIGITAALAVLALPSFAQEAAAGASDVSWKAMAAALVLGIAALGGALGQGRAVSAACEGIARNPGAAGAIRLAMIIGLALIESLVIYALVVALILVF